MTRTCLKAMKKVFIDGSAGTTGLRIRERLASRTDVEVITLAEEVRKDVGVRRDALNAADVALLCLPDAAAVEAAVQAGKEEAEKRELYITHKVIARQSEDIEWFAHLSALGKDKLR